MNKHQFNIDENCLYSPLLPDVVDILSDSGDVFTVEHEIITQLEVKFRVNTSGSNLMSAFVGSSKATLFPQNGDNGAVNKEIDTAENQLKKD